MNIPPIRRSAPVNASPTTQASAAAAGTPAAGPADSLRVQASSVPTNASLGWVKAQGSRLTDAQGKTVPIRGINLGGWLVQEPWMMPLVTHPKGGPAIEDQATMWREVERRFGADTMHELRDAYRSAWITSDDFARIKAAGFNTVRLPFTYDMLQEPDGIKWLDWTIDQAAKQGLYTVLDLHGAPGGQSDAMHTGAIGEPKFFSDPANVAKAADLWRSLAQRYANRPEVLGYDLVNEPMGAKSAKQLYDAQNELYKAIREVDSRHLVFIEDGYKGIDTLPPKEQYGWDNVAYSIHQYKFGAKSEQAHLDALDSTLKKIERVREARDVPVYVGEFNVPDASADTLDQAAQSLERAQVPWSMWSYKVDMPGPARNVWGLYRNDQASQPLDVTRDSADELRRKIALMRTENLQTPPGVIGRFQQLAEADVQGEARPPKTGLGATLSRFVTKVRDWVMRGVMGAVDTVVSLFK